MSIFTTDELEFLASLSRRWRRLYWNELARLQDCEAHIGWHLPVVRIRRLVAQSVGCAGEYGDRGVTNCLAGGTIGRFGSGLSR
jgi:hypothetical protein